MINFDQGNTLNQQNNEFPVGTTIDVTGYVPLFGKKFNEPNQVARLFLDTGKYAAMGFSSEALPQGTTGAISWTMASSSPFAVQISACPGDFGAGLDDNCHTSSVDGGLAWKVGTKPALNPGFYCYLEPGRPYFLNVVAAQEGTPGTSTCTDERCTWLVSVGGQ